MRRSDVINGNDGHRIQFRDRDLIVVHKPISLCGGHAHGLDKRLLHFRTSTSVKMRTSISRLLVARTIATRTPFLRSMSKHAPFAGEQEVRGVAGRRD